MFVVIIDLETRIVIKKRILFKGSILNGYFDSKCKCRNWKKKKNWNP